MVKLLEFTKKVLIIKNWLKYDGVEWRVLGLYDIHNDGTRLSAKMITHQTVDVQ